MGNTQEKSLLGVGLYTPAGISRLTGLPPQRVRRWLSGYPLKGPERRARPVVIRELPRIDGKDAVSFTNLVEMLFVKAFLEHGVSLHTIRLATDAAREFFKEDHPFALKRLLTDGQRVFAQFKDELEREHLMDLIKGQTVFRAIVTRYLKEIDYSFTTEKAAQWWPLGKDQPIVIDPNRSFGAPIVARKGIPTDILHRAVLAEHGDIQKTAWWFEVESIEVAAAVEFEERFAA